jgi:hypothetical protein
MKRGEKNIPLIMLVSIGIVLVAILIMFFLMQKENNYDEELDNLDEQNKKTNELPCVENWECQNWGICTEQGKQMRVCIDLNDCDTTINKPLEQQNCIFQPTINKANNTNTKDPSKYFSKEVFLVSDEDWREILTLIPLTIWTKDDNIIEYPLLIYHKENNAFDVDSIYYFFEQYNPNKISYFGNLPSELSSLLQDSFSIQKKYDKLDNWMQYKDVVYVENDYEKALLASTYASLINAPLIIKNYNDNLDLSKRNIICIGNPTSNCNEQYNLEQLQAKYLEKTQTNKIILVNPNDLDIKLNVKDISLPTGFQTEKGSDIILELYGKMSLASPILASAKHELILSTNSVNYTLVDQFLENKISSLGAETDYLTIVASPDAIQMSKFTGENVNHDLWFEVDNSIYGCLGDEKFQSLSVGRIFGISISDVSAYLSRVLFYEQLPLSNKFAMLVPHGLNGPEEAIAYKMQLKPNEELLELLGLQSESIYLDETSFLDFPIKQALEDKIIIDYSGHGLYLGWQDLIDTLEIIEEDVWLSPSFIIGEGCLTCSYENIEQEEERLDLLFCTNILRRGGLGYVGAIVESGATTDLSRYIMENLINGDSFGETLKKIKQFESTVIGGCKEGQNVYPPFCEPYYILLGDPTINLGFNYPEIEVIEVNNEINGLNLISTITIPQSNQLESWSDSVYQFPHGINGVKHYIEIDPNDPSGNSLRNEGVFTFDVDLSNTYSLNPIKAEFIDSESNLIELSFEQIEKGVVSFINLDIPGKRFVLEIEPIYDEKNGEYKFFVRTFFGGEFTINEFSPSYKYKIYWGLEN